MPRYDYQCRKCENVFEITRSINDSSDVICPHCESKDTKKLISAPAISFRGAGFYKTDSKVLAETKIEKKVETPKVAAAENKSQEKPKDLPKVDNKISS